MNVIHHRDFRPFKSRPFDPRNPHGVVEDGEALSFDVLFRDTAPARGSTVYLTDVPSITRRADFTRSLASARYHVDGSKLIGTGASPTGTPCPSYSARASINVLRRARYS